MVGQYKHVAGQQIGVAGQLKRNGRIAGRYCRTAQTAGRTAGRSSRTVLTGGRMAGRGGRVGPSREIPNSREVGRITGMSGRRKHEAVGPNMPKTYSPDCDPFRWSSVMKTSERYPRSIFFAASIIREAMDGETRQT